MEPPRADCATSIKGKTTNVTVVCTSKSYLPWERFRRIHRHTVAAIEDGNTITSRVDCSMSCDVNSIIASCVSHRSRTKTCPVSCECGSRPVVGSSNSTSTAACSTRFQLNGRHVGCIMGSSHALRVSLRSPPACLLAHLSSEQGAAVAMSVQNISAHAGQKEPPILW